jgi:hypothetical protein
MRHHTSTPSHVPTPAPIRLLMRVASAGFVVAGLGVAGNAVFGDDDAVRSPWIVAVEGNTRDFLDDRAAAHLRELRKR